MSTPEASSRRFTWFAFLALLAVVALAFLQAGRAYHAFLAEHRALWYSSQHDRNEHYLFALQIATALRSADVPGLVERLARATIWPPLHGLLAGTVLALTGPDYRFAVLPSLLAWVGTMILAFLLARRCVPVGGTWAGLVPVAYLLASPLHHGLAVDIMLESTGAFLTLFCLYCYVRIVQDQTLWAWRALAIGLTAMVLEKYNYYVLVAVTLLVAELITRGRWYLERMRQVVGAVRWSEVVRRELRQPLSWLVVWTLLIVLAVWLRGPRPLQLAGWSVAIYPPGNIIQAAYVLAFLRLAWAFWPWKQALALLDGRPRQLLLWHVVPVACYLLLPKHFITFLWYVSPANKGLEQHGTFLDGVRFYTTMGVEHYYTSAGSAFLAVALFAVALLCWRRLRPGAGAVLCLGVLAALLTMRHPNHQVRFLHSWIAAVWVGAGVGAVAWLSYVPLRRGLAVGVVLTLAVVLAHVPAIARAKRSPVGGPVAQVPSLLDVADAVVAESEQVNRLGYLPAMPVQSLSRWRVLERYGKRDRVEYHRHGFGPIGPANQAAFRSWLESTRCDALVYLEPIGSFGRGEVDEMSAFLELRHEITRQERFRLIRQHTFPAQRCRLLVYRKNTDRAER